MSSPAAFGGWQGHAVQTPPPQPTSSSPNEDGITVRPMRLKVLYTFDDQNKTNCLARWPHVLQIQTVMMDEGAAIGVIELKTCIQAIVQCSPELVARIGQDYTVYAYDYSEYDNPLVGQGMLSRVLHATSPSPEAPAQQSRQLITGRVCKNILGLFANGVKETLEVKLRLVPVPTSLQNEFQNTMEKYREMNRSVPPIGFDMNEWNALIQSTPNFGQGQGRNSLPPSQGQMANAVYQQHNGISMEVVNQLLSPNIPEPQTIESFNREPLNALSPIPITAAPIAQMNVIAGAQAVATKRPTSRPSSRASIKRPRKMKQSTPVVGGNTSGYEEGTDGDDAPAPKKRVKTTKATDWNQKSSFGPRGDLRVAASTAGSLRLFRPIAISPAIPGGNHLQEVPRAPTPVPRLFPGSATGQPPAQSGLRRDSFVRDSSLPRSPYGQQSTAEDELRFSIESAGPSPERQDTPAETPPEFGSSPPVMRTRPPSPMRSSPPCPTSPCLPPMPRTDSGFMSGTIDELFGDDEAACPVEDDEAEIVVPDPPKRKRGKVLSRQPSIAKSKPAEPGAFQIEEPGPVELLPTRMPVHAPPKPPKPPKAKGKRASLKTTSRASSVMSEDGSQSLPPLIPGKPQLLPRPPISISQAPFLSQPIYPPPHQQSRPNQQTTHLDTSQQEPVPNNPAPRAQTSVQLPPAQPKPRQAPSKLSETSDAVQEESLSQIFASQITYEKATTPQLGSEHAPAHPSLERQDPAQYLHPPQNSYLQATIMESQIPVEPIPMARAPTTLPTLSLPETRKPQRRPSVPAASSSATDSRRIMVRTASLGSLSLPQVPASDPLLPPSSLHRSQTWSEAPHAMSEAPCPLTEGQISTMSDVEEVQNPEGSLPLPLPAPGGGAVPYNRTWNAKKAAIRNKLETAILNGEMPPYCCNCGAIETPTWRKAWSQECQGAPGYYEYSDEPGKVTAIVVLTRDAEGIPTSYQLIKKYLKAEEDPAEFREFILCNPCGIWMSKYKTQRPPERWENSMIPVEKKIIPPRRPQYQRPSRARKPGAKNSEPPVMFGEQSQMTDGPSPTDTTGLQQTGLSQQTRERSASLHAAKRMNAMTFDAASAALRRAIQSSPARWNGSRHSPIDLDEEEDDTTRRLLFPSPRKDGSPKVLGELTTNVVQIVSGHQKDQLLDAPNKENCPPMTIDANEDEELLKLFEEEMVRPTTPMQKTPPANPFKTPTRPTPSHRPITRSVSKSARKSPSQFFGLTPSRITPRRSPRNHNNGFISPFTATLNQMMSEANSHSQSPSQNMVDDIELDFVNLPDLPLGNHQSSLDNSFSLEDFFSTDVPMPSSPPRAFRMYEDPIGGLNMNNIDWNEFQHYGQGLSAGVGEGPIEEVIVKKEQEPSPQKRATPKKKGENS